MERVNEVLRMHGIKELTPPQEMAYPIIVRSERPRLVVCSNTGSGKTLIAEMAMARAIEPNSELKGVYLVPLKALADEVFSTFRAIFGQMGYRVQLKVGDYEESVDPKGFDILVTTYEKFDSMIRNGFPISKVGLLVVDEVHTLNSDRGAPLEVIISMFKDTEAGIVLLSATIGNPRKLAEWIDGELVFSDYRPVELVEGYAIPFGSTIEVTFPYRSDLNFKVIGESKIRSYIGVAEEIAKKFLEEDKPILVFVNSRRTAEATARRLAKWVLDKLRKPMLNINIREFVESDYEAKLIDPLIRRGVAFHHAGLSLQARRLIEILFRGGDIKVVVATPTLAAGVNLPPYAVLVPVKRFNGSYMAPISVMEYKQMAGRSGRPGFSKIGLSIIYDANEKVAKSFIDSKPEPITPKLADDRNLRIHLNALYAMGKGFEAHRILMNSFSGFVGSIDPEAIRDAESWLREYGFLSNGMSTVLGNLTAKLYLDPWGVAYFLELIREAEPSTPEEYLFLIAINPDIEIRFSVSKQERLELGELFMVQEKWVGLHEEFDIYPVLKTIAILRDWINEVPEDSIYEKWRIGPGDLYTLRENAEWVAHGLSAISRVTGFEDVSEGFKVLEFRISHGVREELLELVKIKGIGRVRARILWNHGVKNLSDLTRVDPRKLAKLRSFGPAVVKQIFKQLGREVDVSDVEEPKDTLEAFLK